MSLPIQKKAFLSQDNKEGFRNPWVIGWIALIVIVFGVNAGMVATAVVTNPGLVDDNYYERGRDHERAYQERQAQRSALAWQVSLDLPERVIAGRTGIFSFNAADSYGNAISGADVKLTAYRPSDATADFTVTLPETGPGHYRAEVNLPLKGIWDLKIQMVRGEDQWDLSRRVSVHAN